MTKEVHKTFWQQINIVPTHRYYIIFSKWKDIIDYNARSITGYDNYEDVKEEINLLNEIYEDVPKPTKVYSKSGKNVDKCDSKYMIQTYPERYRFDYDYSDNAYFWGYVVLDMKKCEFLKISTDVIKIGTMYSIFKKVNRKKDLNIYDYFFRKNSEVPEDYEWHHKGAEYEGWLQFRWGDGKNAIDYVEPPKKERPGVTEVREFYDEATDSYIKRKVRVVYVGWNDPLPKKEKGIIYEYPNHEPVIFPGELGYENGYSIQEWSLAEEIAGEEYLHKQGKNNFTVDTTTSSIADILGDDNPLLKLKFDN